MKLSTETLRQLVSFYIHLLDKDLSKAETFLMESIGTMVVDKVLSIEDWRAEVDQWKDKNVLYEVGLTNFHYFKDEIYAGEESAKVAGKATSFEYTITVRMEGMNWKCRSTVGHSTTFGGYFSS